MNARKRRALESRNEKIKEAIANGEPTAAVAQRFKISSTRVLQIIGKRPDRGNKPKTKGRIENEEQTQTPSIDFEFENQVAYFFGRIEAQLEVFASVAGYPVNDVARRISELLSRKNVRKVVRASH